MKIAQNITLSFLNIDYLYKVLSLNGDFINLTNTNNVQFFGSIKECEKYAISNKLDIKNLKIVSIDQFNNVNTLKYIK